MASELASAEYAFLILLKAAGRELSNTEMDKLYRVRLISPAYEKLNAVGYVASDTTRRPYRHAITKDGLKALSDPLSIDGDDVDPTEKRSLREKQLWAALVAQHNQSVGAPAPRNGSEPAVAAKPEKAEKAEKPEKPAGLDGRIRAAYTELAGAPGDWVDLTRLRPLLADVAKAELDRALVRMLNDPDVRLDEEPFGHRVGAEERRAAVRVGGEDRHKLAIGLS